MKRFFWLGLVCGLTACSGNDKGPASQSPEQLPPRISQVVGIGKIQPAQDIIQLAPQVNGLVQKVYKKENDTVRAGDLLLELDHAVDDASVTELEKAVASQAAQVNADEAALQEYQLRYQNAATELSRLENLLKKGAETQQKVDDASTNMKVYGANLKKQENLAAVSKSKLAEARAKLQVARAQRDQKFVRAPVSGTILEMDPQPGTAVDTRVAFAQLSPAAPLIALAEIDELFAGRVKLGQKAWIRNPGSSDTLATGTVYFVSSFLRQKSLFLDEAGEKEDRRVREIKIRLDDPAGLLINSRVECVVEINSNPQ